jgi:predicted dehydrogenase
MEGARVVAVADPHARNLNGMLDRIERATGRRPESRPGGADFEALLGRDDIDAAIVATPNDLHARIALRAIECGKHLYLEKPLALTDGECREIERASAGSKAVFMTGFQRRLSPRAIEGIERIRRGEIGRIVEGFSNQLHAGSPPLGVDDWLNARARSGDWMLEQACSTWDVLHWALGATPLRAHGTGARGCFAIDRPGRDVTDFFSATLEFPGDAIVRHHLSWFTPRHEQPGLTGSCERLAGMEGAIDLTQGLIAPKDRSTAPTRFGRREPSATDLAVRHFFACVRGGRKPASGIDNAAAATLTGLLVRRAVDERRTVEMEEILAGE